MTDIADGTDTAVVDRFEDELAVVLVEGDGDVVGEMVVEASVLPEAGRHVDAVMVVEFVERELVDVEYRAEETEERQEAAQSRFERLSERPHSDDEE
jgi:hypothetical protein